MYKVIVAGSRDFDNYELLEEKLKLFLKGKRPSEIEIVSGTARGADKMGEFFGEKWGCNIKRFPADWETHGRKAGVLRNREMSLYADGCIVFWDGKSSGTRSMIEFAKEKNLDLEIVMYRIALI